ncbi:MAG: EAL domain-containing protein [Gammaproteobacteria bacterium]|nr:EAL domain-containing protein [Gammaproteobacteria bacterium]MBU2279076.1 EAL domain-containing protein [Gammaproteobacteria bacterium]MBU2428761.1 EAL domain-containing protein [Gammaproteobacteria bacterium]
MPNKVLLVDDELSMLRALERLLQISGYRVFTANSGAEALNLLQQEQCQVVISDYRMPQMTGAELLAQVKRLYPETVCLVLSGYADFQSVLQLLNSGTAFRFLQKPWENEQLLAEIAAAFLFYRHQRSERIRNQLLIAGHGALLELNENAQIMRSNGPAQQLLSQSAAALNHTLFDRWFKLNPDQQQSFLQDIHGSIEASDHRGEACELHVQYRDSEATIVGFKHLQQQDGPASIYTSTLMDQHAVLQQMSGLLQQQKPFAVAAIRLKNFSDWSDMLGFAEAGLLFETVSQNLMQACQPCGSLAYLANELFILTMPSAVTEVLVHQQLTDILQKVRQQLELQALVLRPQFTITYCLAPEDGDDAKQLLNNALTSNRIHVRSHHSFFMRYSASMADKKRQQLQISEALFLAVERDQFELYFQTKLDLRSNQCHSAEALLRWRHPELGFVPPALFIPIAEHDGQMIEIGLWVLRQACLAVKRWQHDQLPFQRLAVNISGVQLQQANFISQVQRIFAETEVDPAMLEFELTESWMIEDMAHSAQALQAVKALGVQIAIDDFGTGYSSLAYLSRLPVDVLKIDRSLVIDLESNINTQSMVSNICRMAHALNVEVVVEGVESAEQLLMLRTMGCDVAQGYLIARPLPEVDFLRHLVASAVQGES